MSTIWFFRSPLEITKKMMLRRFLLILGALALVIVPLAGVSAQEALVESVCLVTDLGRINDGTFNQYAYEGMQRAADDLGLESRYIETQAQTDYAANIQTCLDEEFDTVITVGFLIADATFVAAEANPDVYFIGVDQFVATPLPNYVGIQFREDQAGFLVGAMAALVTESGIIGGVYGIAIPPVVKFRNGYEQGARYINPDIDVRGIYIDDFLAPDRGAAAAEQLIGEGADVIFGAGGPTGSGAISFAANEGVSVIGVDQDEYFTTFDEGASDGAENLITSALKRVDNGVFQMIERLTTSEGFGFETGMFNLEVANDGIGYAPAHDATVSEDVTAQIDEILAGLIDGSIETGVDPVSGELMTAMPEIMGEALIESVCLVTDLGRINDGTFNQYAYEGMERAASDLGLESRFIETTAQTDYAVNIQTCLDEEFDAIVTVGFLIADATYTAAVANPDVYFIGIDQFIAAPLPNLVGLQAREDQAGFLVGAMAALLTESDIIGGVYGVPIPPVVRFRNGFEQGARYINPDIDLRGIYIDDFLAPDRGAAAAEQLIGEGVDVIMGAGGPTGSGAISYAATEGVFVIGVDQDEYFTTFDSGATPGAENLISSALKRIDNGVYQMIERLVTGEGFGFETGMFNLEVANEGIGFAPAHDSSVPEEVTAQVEEILAGLVDGSIETGVDPLSGELLPE